jgi:hypothetical protein
MITIPTLQQLYTGILSSMEAEYGINIPLITKNFLRALAAVQAAKLKLYYILAADLQKNIFVDTADPEAIGGTLERFGRVKLGRAPFPARAGEYELEVIGTVGSIIKASTTFKSNDDTQNPGKLFILDEEFELETETDYITVRALEAGTDSQLTAGEKLTATAPLPGVNQEAIVNSVIEEPAAAEDLEDYRQKTIDSYRLEAQGGAPTDYRLWAADAQGVEKVYPYAASGESAVINLYVEATEADSTDGKGTPSASLLEDVEEVIEFNPDDTLELNERGRRPLGVFDINFLPITPREVDVVITGFDGLTSSIEDSIETEMESKVKLIRPFVPGADILSDKNDILDTNKLIAMILTANPGAVFTSVTLKIDNVAVSTITFMNGDIPHFNSVTFD